MISLLNTRPVLRLTSIQKSLLVLLLTIMYACTEESAPSFDTNTVERDPQTTMPLSRDQDIISIDLANQSDMNVELDSSVPSFNKVRVRFEWQGDDFYRMPWPSDARLTAQGTPDLSDFPGDTPTLTSIREYLQNSIQGFSLMPVVYIPFWMRSRKSGCKKTSVR